MLLRPGGGMEDDPARCKGVELAVDVGARIRVREAPETRHSRDGRAHANVVLSKSSNSKLITTMNDPSTTLPDRYWIEVAEHILKSLGSHSLILGPNEFLAVLPGLIAVNIRKRMIPDVTLQAVILHKGMLDRVDPEFLHDLKRLTPTFANDVFLVYDGNKPGPSAQKHRHEFSSVEDCLAHRLGRHENDGIHRTGIVVTIFSRPGSLAKTLHSLRAYSDRIVVVDDGSAPALREANPILWRLTRSERPPSCSLGTWGSRRH
jgi:hypothetical protein